MGNGVTRVRGIAARAGGWSARHRWAAVGIWLLFVVLAMTIGSAAGRVDVRDSDELTGETHTAARIIEDAGIKEPAGESVLIQAKGGGITATDPRFRATVTAVVRAVEKTGRVTDVMSPYDSKSISKDGRSALVRFDMRGDADTAGDRVEPVLEAVAGVRKDHTELRVEEIGGASMQKTFSDAFGDDFAQAEYSAVPVAQFGDRLPIVATYNRVNEAFPGGSEPAEVVVKANDINAAEVRSALAAFRAEAISSGASRGPIDIKLHGAQNVALISVPLVGGSDLDKAGRSLDLLRDRVRPDTLGRVEGVQAPITGQVAGSADFNDQLVGSVVPVFAFVVVFAFLLMLVSFRSLTIAITSIALNLLSVGAAYGILVAVFQHGWGASLVGAEGVGAIITWLPLFLFVILFGLSMDYHVFVVSRIREARLRGRTTKEAITHGVVTTAGVVTSAAVIMVAVFAIFGTLSMQSMKQMGVGLAAAVLIDATVIRGVLLPSVMALLGERNWYLPKWLHRLPDLSHDESSPAVSPPPPPAVEGEKVGV